MRVLPYAAERHRCRHVGNVLETIRERRRAMHEGVVSWKQAVDLGFDDRIALACGGVEPRPTEHRDTAAVTLDQAGRLQLPGDRRDALPANPEQIGHGGWPKELC